MIAARSYPASFPGDAVLAERRAVEGAGDLLGRDRPLVAAQQARGPRAGGLAQRRRSGDVLEARARGVEPALVGVDASGAEAEAGGEALVRRGQELAGGAGVRRQVGDGLPD